MYTEGCVGLERSKGIWDGGKGEKRHEALFLLGQPGHREVGWEHASECLLAPGLSADGAELGPKVWSWRGFVPRLVCECLGAFTEFVTYICAA